MKTLIYLFALLSFSACGRTSFLGSWEMKEVISLQDKTQVLKAPSPVQKDLTSATSMTPNQMGLQINLSEEKIALIQWVAPKQKDDYSQALNESTASTLFQISGKYEPHNGALYFYDLKMDKDPKDLETISLDQIRSPQLELFTGLKENQNWPSDLNPNSQNYVELVIHKISSRVFWIQEKERNLVLCPDSLTKNQILTQYKELFTNRTKASLNFCFAFKKD